MSGLIPKTGMERERSQASDGSRNGAVQDSAARGRERRWPFAAKKAWAGTRPFRPVLVLTIALIVVMSVVNSTFRTNVNIQNLLTNDSVLWVIAMGQTFALLSGGADLSSGAIVALVGVLIAKGLGGGLPGGIVLALALLFGAGLGCFTNGFLIGRLRLSFFIVTLGTLTAFTGVITLWSHSQSTAIVSPAITWLASASFLGIGMPIWTMIVVFIVALSLQRLTYFGRNVYAVGGSLTAARLSGIRTERTIMLVYGLLGLCAGLGGVMEVGQAGANNPVADPTLALQAIAAVLLGGTSLFGGSGGVVGTAIGVLFLAVLQNALNLAGVASAWQAVVTGVILIAAVATVRGGSDIGRLGRLTHRLSRPRSRTHSLRDG